MPDDLKQKCQTVYPRTRAFAGWRKIAVKVVDIFGNDTMTIADVAVGRKK